jgi:hypothetical protein
MHLHRGVTADPARDEVVELGGADFVRTATSAGLSVATCPPCCVSAPLAFVVDKVAAGNKGGLDDRRAEASDLLAAKAAQKL